MMHTYLTYHTSMLNVTQSLPRSLWGHNGHCINSTCTWPLSLPCTAPRACTPQRYLTIMLSVNGVSTDGIGDHISGTLGRARAKAAKNGRSAGHTPQARDENGGKFALFIVFSHESALRAVAGVLMSDFWWPLRLYMLLLPILMYSYPKSPLIPIFHS